MIRTYGLAQIRELVSSVLHLHGAASAHRRQTHILLTENGNQYMQLGIINYSDTGTLWFKFS